jgi:hypothetical protein
MRAALLLCTFILIPTAGEARLCGWLNVAAAVPDSTAIFEGEVLGPLVGSLSGAGGSRFLRVRVLRVIKGKVRFPFAFVNIPCVSEHYPAGQRVVVFTRGDALLFHDSVSDAGIVAVRDGFQEGATPSDTVTNALIGALGERPIRAAAMRHLASFKSTAAAKAMDRFIDDEDGVVRSRVLAHRARDGDLDAMRAVIRELMSQRLNVEGGVSVIHGTPEHGRQEELFTYYGLLSGFGGRCSAANRREEMGHQPERPFVLESDRLAESVAPLQRHRSDQIRDAVSRFLRECRSVASTKLLVPMMDHTDKSVSYHAMMGLCMRLGLAGCPGRLRFEGNRKEYISLIRAAVAGKRVELPRRR